jgi:hypothetical protein
MTITATAKVQRLPPEKRPRSIFHPKAIRAHQGTQAHTMRLESMSRMEPIVYRATAVGRAIGELVDPLWVDCGYSHVAMDLPGSCLSWLTLTYIGRESLGVPAEAICDPTTKSSGQSARADLKPT